MTADQVVALAQQTLSAALWIGGPILVLATVVSLLVSIGQAMTSTQEVTVSTVPRLAAVAVGLLVLLPWMMRQMVGFTVKLFSDFSPFVR